MVSVYTQSVDGLLYGIIGYRLVAYRYGYLKFFSRWPPAAILDLNERDIVPFDPPSWKTPVRSKSKMAAILKKNFK